MPKRKRGVDEIVIPQDVVEEILEKLPVKSLLRFKAVSKLWRREIECRRFQERHLMHQQKSRDPSILVYSRRTLFPVPVYDYPVSLTTLSFGTRSVSLDSQADYPVHPKNIFFFVETTPSCDGLICFYSESFTYVINPATRWYRKLPQATIQTFLQTLDPDNRPKCAQWFGRHPLMGMGKDIIRGIYKLVWLYNSNESTLDGPADVCEIFSFDTNNNTSWRSDVIASCPYPVFRSCKPPPYAHGSLHWFIEAPTETQVLSLDLHTETFKVMTHLPVASSPSLMLTMSTLNNRLCLSEDKGDTHIIWSLNQDTMTWDKTYSIVLYSSIPSPFEDRYYFLPKPPISTLVNNRLLFYDDCSDNKPKLVVHDVGSSSNIYFFTAPYYLAGAIPYSESLITLP